MTKLDIINDMLASISELPLNELDARHPHVAAGLRILEQKNREFQVNLGAGWWFNILPHYPLHPDADKHIHVPYDLLKYSSPAYPQRFHTVKGVLWDNSRNSNEFDGTVIVDAIRCIDVEDLPPLAHAYVSYESIKRFSTTYEGDMQRFQQQADDSRNALVALRAQDIREKRANTQRNPQVIINRGRPPNRIGPYIPVGGK